MFKKRILAATLCAAMVLPFSGCSDKANNSTSNSAVEEKPKTLSEVFDDISKIEACNYTFELFSEAQKSVPASGTADVMTTKTESFGISFNGGINKNQMAATNVMLKADINNDGSIENNYLTDIVSSDGTVYINVKPFVDLMAAQMGDDAELPETLTSLGYVSITPDEAKDYINNQSSKTEQSIPDVKLDDLTATVDNISQKTGDLIKALYGKCESLITSSNGVFTLKIDNSNIKTVTDAVLTMIDDGSMKTYLENIKTSLDALGVQNTTASESVDSITTVSESFDIQNTTVSESADSITATDDINDIDKILADMKSSLENLNFEEMNIFSIVVTLKIPTADNAYYTINATGETIDKTSDDVAKIAVTLAFKANNDVKIVIPDDAKPFTDAMTALEGAMS